MTALLEARNVTKIFGGGLFERRRTTSRSSDFSLTIEHRAAVVSPRSSAKAAAARPRWRACCSASSTPTSGRGALSGQGPAAR